MNKKIFEMAEEARLIRWETLPSGAVTPDHDSYAKAMKFAEMIVLESANYASRNWEHGHLLAQDLKTHFGVE